MKKKQLINFLLFNLSLGFFLALLLTTPSVFFISNHLIGYPHDGFEYIYKFWWFEKAIFDFGVSPANTVLLNYPVYDQNLTIISSPLLPFISIILSFINSNLIVYNIMLFSSFIFNMAFMALICFDICQNKLAASIAGMIFAFNCNMVAHAIGGHLAQVSTYFVLFFVLSFFRLEKKKSYSAFLTTGILGGLCLLLDLKVAAYTFLPIYFFLIVYFIRKTEKKLIKKSLLQLLFLNVLMGLIVIPFFKPLIMSSQQGEMSYMYQPGTIKHSASLLSFMVPPPESFYIKIFPGLSKLSEEIALPGWHENVFFIGWLTPLLAVAGGIFIWKEKKIFGKEIILLLITMLLLVLGPYLKIGLDPVSFKINLQEFWISMPYFYLNKLPFFDLGRTPSRFMTLIWFSLSILAAYGIGKIIKRFTNEWVKRIITTVLVIVILLELNFTFPFPVYPIQVPQFITSLENDESEFAILDLPLWDYRCGRQQLYFATIHQRPIVGGNITRRSKEAEQSMQSIENLLYLSNPDEIKFELQTLTIKYVVDHKNCRIELSSRVDKDQLRNIFGDAIFMDENIDVYSVY